MFSIRPVQRPDLAQLSALRAQLWPEATAKEHAAELRAVLDANVDYLIVAEIGQHLIGFLEARLRSHADGCETSPVGYLEGWYVAADYRRRGVGRALFEQFEKWAKEQGCKELASDTWLDNVASQEAHLRLGFSEVDRVVTYRKALDWTVELGPHARPPIKQAPRAAD